MKRTITQFSVVLRPSRWVRVSIILVTILLAAVACGPSDPIQKIRQQIAAGDVFESLEPLRDLIKEDPDNPQLLFLYSQVLIKTGQPGLADWPLRKAMQDPVWFERAATLVAKIEAAGGNFENAAQTYAEILERNPDNNKVRLSRADVCSKSPPLFEEALAEVDRILERDPEQLNAYKPRIVAYLGLNKPEEAGLALEELGVRTAETQDDGDPVRGWHCATMAIFADESGDTSLAQERWAVCEEKYPEHPNVVAKSIEFHKSQGELQRALEVAEAAFALELTEKGGYRLVVAQLLRLLERPDEAESLLKEAVESGGELDRSAALLALTDHYKEVGNLAAAAEALERALAVAPKSIGPQHDLLFSLADMLIQVGQSDRALDLTKKMTVASHRSLVRARVADKNKQYAKALALYDETTRLWPENPYAPYHAARAAMAVGQFDRAFDSFLLSIRANDQATDARLQAARLLDSQGRPESSLEMLGSTRSNRSLASQLLTIKIVARDRGPAFGSRGAKQVSMNRPAQFGAAIAAAAEGASEREDSRDAWTIVEPLVGLDLTPENRIPILRAAVEWAPGEPELATLKPLVAKAVESDPDAANVREIEGMFFERSGALDKAEASYRQAIKAEPERASVYLRLARTLATTEPQPAIDLIEQALAAGGEESFDARLFLLAISELPNAAGVEALLESALELAPANGQIAYRLALMLEARGAKPERIVRLATRATRLRGGDEAASLRDLAQQRL